MRDLMRERERLGLSRAFVASSTRIPLRYVVALEEAEDAGKNPPPFLFGYRRQYEAFLDSLGDGAARQGATAASAPAPYVRPEEPAPAPEAKRVPVARLVLGGFVATLTLVLGIKVGSALLARAPEATPEAEAESAVPVQKVELRAVEPTRVSVVADGSTLFSGVLEPGVTRAFEGRERLEVDASDLTRLTVRHNGERIEPLGNLTYGRRLVFIQEPM